MNRAGERYHVRTMKLAIATCSSLPDWEIDDAPLHEALVARNIEIAHEVWTNPDVQWNRYDACLIRTTWDYVQKIEHYLNWADQTADQIKLFNPARTVRWNTCKSYLRDLETSGLPVVPTRWIEAGTPVDLGTILDEESWKRGFMKPRVGATAFGTMRFSADRDSLQDAQSNLDRMLQTQGMLIQPYLEDVETRGEWSGIFIDGVWSHAVQKIPVPGDYRVQDDFGATDQPGDADGPERAVSEQVMEVIRSHPEWTGEQDGMAPLYCRVDLLRSETRLMINEVELVEPSLFFRHHPKAADALADALIERC